MKAIESASCQLRMGRGRHCRHCAYLALLPATHSSGPSGLGSGERVGGPQGLGNGQQAVLMELEIVCRRAVNMKYGCPCQQITG